MREYRAITQKYGVELFDTFEEAETRVMCEGSGELITFFLRKNPLSYLGAIPETESKCIGMRVFEDDKWWGVDIHGSGRRFPIEMYEREF